MALNLDTAIRISANVQGGNQVQSFVRDLRGLEGAAKISTADLGRMNIAINRMAREAGNTTVGLRQHITALQSLRDRVDINSNAYKRLGNEIEGLRGKLRGLDGDAKRAADSLQQTGTAGMRSRLRDASGGALGALATGGGIQGAVGAMAGGLAASGSVAGLGAAAGIGATAAFGVVAINNARALEEQSRKLRVMSDDAVALQSGIIGLVREQSHLISTTEASAAAYDILQAGFSGTTDILNVLRASTLGAVGGFTDVVTVADAVTSVLNGYGRAASDASKIVDQMKAATDDGKISMEAYAQSIGKVIPSAAAAKLPLEEINAAISALTAQGVPVETTFSGINQAIKTILKPTQEARDLSKALGLEFNAQALATKGLGGFLEDVANKTGKSSDALSVLFSDIDGYKAVVALLNDDLRRFNQFTDNQANAIGRSAKAAEIAIDPVKRFDNAWKDLSSTLGNLVLPALTNVLNGITIVTQKAIEMTGRIDQNNFANNPNPFTWIAPLNGSRSGTGAQRLRNAGVPGRYVVGGVTYDTATGRPISGTQSNAASQNEAARNRATQITAQVVDGTSASSSGANDMQREIEKTQKDQLDFQNELSKIKLDAEKRLMDYRVQALERVQQIERDMANERKQAELDTQEIKTQIIQQQQVNALQQQRAELQNLGRDTSLVDQAIERLQAAHELDNQLFRNRITLEDRRMQIEQKVADYQTNTAKEIRQITIDAAEQYQNRIQQGIAGALGGTTGPMGALLARIRSGEGNYTSINRGVANDTPGGMPSLTSMTVGQVMSLQSSGRAYAVGAYQFIPETLRGAVQRSGINLGAQFNPATQDRLAIELILGGVKRPALSSYLRGRSNNLTAAENEAAREWAALTGSSGRGMYDGTAGNRGSISVRDLLPLVRQQVMSGQLSTVAPQAFANNIRSLQPAQPLQPQNPELLQVPGVQQVKSSAAQLLKAEEERRKALDIQAQQQYQSGFVTQYAQVTNQLDAQGKQIKEQFEDYQKTLQLQRTGLSPELAQQRVQLERMSQIEIKLLEAQKRDIEAELKKTTLTGNQVKENEANLKLVTDRLANQRQLVDSMMKEAAAQESLQQKYEQYKSLVDNTANAIGNGLGSAMDLLIEGTDNWGNSLREIASGVLVDIAKQLTQTMVVQPAVTGIQSILGSLMPAIGGASSGFGLEYAAPTFANGGIMTDAGPLPLRTYAKGGIANSPQLALFGEGRRPEAYVPLPDGRTIPVTMRGGGGVNVSVNVDARGSSVEGSGNNANALGRAIAASVQAELIRQKRPGGLLA